MKKSLFVASALLSLLVAGAGCSRNPADSRFSDKPDPTGGRLIKGTSYTTVYYLGNDGKRYVFPNDKTYLTWFDTFSYVRKITDEELSAKPLGGNVTYKPASRLVKIDTDPKVYVVTRGGVLRWIKSERIAQQVFGDNWRSQIDDLPDPFFTNYKLGQDITDPNEFSPSNERANTTNIDQDKNLLNNTNVSSTH